MSQRKRGEFARDRDLSDQIRRASGSIMHNIAEGFDGGSNAEFVKFLRYAQRSASEVQSELYVALDQTYISEEKFRELYDLADHARQRSAASSPTSSAPNAESSKRTAINEERGTKNKELHAQQPATLCQRLRRQNASSSPAIPDSRVRGFANGSSRWARRSPDSRSIRPPSPRSLISSTSPRACATSLATFAISARSPASSRKRGPNSSSTSPRNRSCALLRHPGRDLRDERDGHRPCDGSPPPLDQPANQQPATNNQQQRTNNHRVPWWR